MSGEIVREWYSDNERSRNLSRYHFSAHSGRYSLDLEQSLQKRRSRLVPCGIILKLSRLPEWFSSAGSFVERAAKLLR